MRAQIAVGQIQRLAQGAKIELGADRQGDQRRHDAQAGRRVDDAVDLRHDYLQDFRMKMPETIREPPPNTATQR